MHTPTSRCSRTASGAATIIVTLGLLLGGPAAAAPSSVAAPRAHASVSPAGHAAGLARAIIPAQGTIVALPDLRTASATPTHGGSRCRLRVESTLELGGTVTGTATGVTRATIHAPCAEATSNPPGTFADTFAFTGHFRGTVSAVDAMAEVRYAGVTRPGGEVSALLFLHGDAALLAAVQARADDSGTYSGTYRGAALTTIAHPEGVNPSRIGRTG